MRNALSSLVHEGLPETQPTPVAEAATIVGERRRRQPRGGRWHRLAWPILGAALVVAIIVTVLVITTSGSRHVSATPIPPAPGRVSQVAYLDENTDVWLFDARTGASQRLTTDGDERNYSTPKLVGANGVSYIVPGETLNGVMTPNSLWVAEHGTNSKVLQPAADIDDYDWNPDGHMAAYLAFGGGVHLFDMQTGSDRPITTLLPDIRSLANTTNASEDEQSVWWSPDGRLILVVDTLTDPNKGATVWVLRPDGSQVVPPTTGTLARWSQDGKSVYLKRAKSWFEMSVADGSVAPLPIRYDAWEVAVSPDGRHLAYNDTAASPGLWVYDVKTRTDRSLGVNLVNPVWVSSSALLATSSKPSSSALSNSTPWADNGDAETVDITTAQHTRTSIASTDNADTYPGFVSP
jgi:hypothetical protein